MAVMEAESTCGPVAHNYSDATGDDSWGLFQINLYGNLKQSRPSSSWLVEPENNVSHAYKMWKGGGWSQWGAYASGKYLEHL